MSDRKKIEAAVQRGLYPMIRLLMEYGMTEAHFAGIARSVFVKAAAEAIEKDQPESGKPATAARISVMTGVPRNAINEILNSKTVIGQDEWFRNRCADLLTAWHNTPGYVDNKGKPVAIPFSDDKAPSFKALAEALEERRRSWLSPKAILDELKYVGAVEEVPANPDDPDNVATRLVAKERVFRRVGSSIEDLEAAMDQVYNLLSSRKAVMVDGSEEVLANEAIMLDADRDETRALLRDLRKYAINLLDTAENEFSSTPVEKGGDPDNARRVGIGAYVFADDEIKESRYFSSTIDEEDEQKLANE